MPVRRIDRFGALGPDRHRPEAEPVLVSGLGEDGRGQSDDGDPSSGWQVCVFFAGVYLLILFIVIAIALPAAAVLMVERTTP
jgi:hypothetical protein